MAAAAAARLPPTGLRLLLVLLVLLPLRSVCVRTPTPSFAPDVMQNVTAIRGQNAEFRCRILDAGPYRVAFLRVAEDAPRVIAYDEQVFHQPDKYELRKRVSDNEWILTVKNVEEMDAGGYACQLNTNPVAARTGFVLLKVPPSVSRSSTPSAVEVREGHNVTLNCEASGNPQPRITWRRQDRQIIRFNGATGYGASVYNGSELTLTRVSRKHMSEYVCLATNDIPPDETWTVKLHVTFEPSVIPQSTSIESSIGAMVRLVCNVEAWPRAMVTWYHNDMELFDSGSFSMEQSVAERYKTVHVLEIKFVERHNLGFYRCVAVNDYGKQFATIRLIEATPLYAASQGLITEGSASPYPDEERQAGDNIDDEDIKLNNAESTDNNTELRQPSSASSKTVCFLMLSLHLLSQLRIRRSSYFLEKT